MHLENKVKQCWAWDFGHIDINEVLTRETLPLCLTIELVAKLQSLKNRLPSLKKELASLSMKSMAEFPALIR